MRHTGNYTVPDEGRDKGKLFLLTEMSASAGEWWALRVIMALIGANVQLPDDFQNMGMAGLAQFGLSALGSLQPERARPLLDEMMACVKIIPDPTKTHVNRELIEEDIEEVMTRVNLKMEVWNLHTGFCRPRSSPTAARRSQSKRTLPQSPTNNRHSHLA